MKRSGKPNNIRGETAMNKMQNNGMIVGGLAGDQTQALENSGLSGRPALESSNR